MGPQIGPFITLNWDIYKLTFVCLGKVCYTQFQGCFFSLAVTGLWHSWRVGGKMTRDVVFLEDGDSLSTYQTCCLWNIHSWLKRDIQRFSLLGVLTQRPLLELSWTAIQSPCCHSPPDSLTQYCLLLIFLWGRGGDWDGHQASSGTGSMFCPCVF